MSAQPVFAPFEEPLSVPLALRSRKNWIGWRLVHDPANPDKPLKMPVVLVSGVPVNDYLKPHAHVTYDEALAQVEPLKLSGLGFVVTPDCGMWGCDMDNCRNPATGVVNAREQSIIDRKETYFEISPSGRGVRFFVLSDIPLRKAVIGGGVEMYSSGRFLTFTGRRILGTPLEVQRAPYAVDMLMQWAADANAARRAAKGLAASNSGGPAAGSFEEKAKREAGRNSPMGRINEAARKDMDAWVPELFPSARKDGTGLGYRVSSVELGRPLQEDLSLHPDGFMDFGVHDLGDAREGKRTAIDVVMEWHDPPLSNVEAAEWLGVRVGVPFDGPNTGSSGASVVEPPDPGPLVALPYVAGQKPTPREWLVHGGWAPMKKVTLLQGDGGDGKSLLMHQLQASCATGLPWIGLAVEPVVSMGVYTEDDPDDTHERQANIDLAYGQECCLTGRMHRFPRSGEENELVVFDRARRPLLTKFYSRVEEAVRDLGARLLVLDVAVDLYGGNEIVRPEVRALFRPLTKLAQTMNGAVVMSMHVSQSGIRTDGGHSGSTDWSNAARSRLYLNRPRDDTGGLLDPDARLLTRKKANYAALGDSVALRWVGGVLVPDGASLASGAARAFKRPVEDVFMNILAAVASEKQVVSHKPKSGMYAPVVFARRSPREKNGYGRVDFERAMQELLKTRKIIIESHGNPSRQLDKLIINPL